MFIYGELVSLFIKMQCNIYLYIIDLLYILIFLISSVYIEQKYVCDQYINISNYQKYSPKQSCYINK